MEQLQTPKVPEYTRRAQQRYREKNRDALNQYYKEYYQKNKEKHREYYKNYRQKKKVENTISI